MPDEDRFERQLRGKGWRRAYRLARGNAPFPNVIDALMKAAAHALREDLKCRSLPEISKALYRAVALQRQRLQAYLFDSDAPFTALSDELAGFGTRNSPAPLQGSRFTPHRTHSSTLRRGVVL